ncbi:hypothetical protein [Mesorhizobium sp. SP-1A]|uniref:hypothetical protein n=1 Tax=Mesorhizobium sp. SP-1A TaxID=3077840 RepID=UPI0028F73F0C|nr:hypothetical protein [Mesorhizobium sp. SP-1A]
MAFAFITRNSARDSETDCARFSRLAAMLDDLLEEVEAERAGLYAGYRQVAGNTAFSLEEYEVEQLEALSARADELTAELIACSKRLQSLEEQAGFIEKLRGEVLAFKPA